MPLTQIQRDVLGLIAGNRNPNSYVAGATLLHSTEESPRYSRDIDIFHDTTEAVLDSMRADRATLESHDYRFEIVREHRTFVEAFIQRGTHGLHLEWAADSAWRFFPLMPDALFGYRLHPADMATNKVLAAASRREARDYVDLLHLDKTFLSLGAMIWAAAGKDPGMTPDFILAELARNSHYRQEDFARIEMAAPPDIPGMKQRWIRMMETGRTLIHRLPAPEIGLLYLDSNGRPASPNPGDPEAFQALHRHAPSLGGAWPTIPGVEWIQGG